MKTCPQCQTHFEGRSNKIYCSQACKMKAFHQRENPLIVGSEEENEEEEQEDAPNENTRHKHHHEPRLVPKPQAPQNQVELMHLQFSMKKMELEHQQQLAYFQAQEKQKERDFELRKKQLEFDKEKQSFQNQIDTLHQNLASLQHEKEGKAKQLHQLPKETPASPFLPLQTKYCEYVANTLDLHGETLTKEELLIVLQKLEELLLDFEETAEAHPKLPCEEFEPLAELLAFFETYLPKFGFMQSRIKIQFPKRFYQQLEESINP